MKDSKTLAVTFSALAHPARVDIFKHLLSTHPSEQNANALVAATGIAPSTLSHHLREMEKGGVIARRAVGTSTLTALDLPNLIEIASTLMTLCCSAQENSNTEEPE